MMPNARATVTAAVPPEQIEDVLDALVERTRLLKVVRAMSHEIERLSEDNAQLYAAVKIYREVARQCLERIQ
ncbi:MAG TPA: hypothetical protein VKU19_07890 [Bryobacteraceae bacterium]|nr:hypothetical protein [Bryobacteraceae bacterium]